MIPEFIVLFRESLEVALVIGILLVYLTKTKNQPLNKYVWAGLGAGIVLSILFAIIIEFALGGFEASEELFEGTFMIATTVFVSWLILWVLSQRQTTKALHKSVDASLERGGAFGIFILSMLATMREGVEAVLLLGSVYFSTGAISLIGGLLGIVTAALFSFSLFKYAFRFSVDAVLKVSALLLILLAAGLFSQGIHELQEAKVLPTWIEHVYNVTPPLNLDGSYPFMHEKGVIGSILKGLIGYDTAPSDLQIIGYIGYLGTIFLLYKKFVSSS